MIYDVCATVRSKIQAFTLITVCSLLASILRNRKGARESTNQLEGNIIIFDLSLSQSQNG